MNLAYVKKILNAQRRSCFLYIEKPVNPCLEVTEELIAKINREEKEYKYIIKLCEEILVSIEDTSLDNKTSETMNLLKPLVKDGGTLDLEVFMVCNVWYNDYSSLS